MLDSNRCHTEGDHLRAARHRRMDCPTAPKHITRTLDGGIAVTRTQGTVTATATQNKTAGGWDFVVVDDWGQLIAADSLPNYGAVLTAFKIVGL
jgi:hypothetical protein